MDRIAPHFADELRAAGLGSVRLSWREDGRIEFTGATDEEKAAVQRVLGAHRPNQRPSPRPVPPANVDDEAGISELIDGARTIDDIRPLLKALVNKVAAPRRG